MDVTSCILPILLRGRKGQGVVAKKPVWRSVNHGRMTVEGEALKDTTTLEIRGERAPREGGRQPALAPLCSALAALRAPTLMHFSPVRDFCSFAMTPAPSFPKCVLMYVNKSCFKGSYILTTLGQSQSNRFL